MRAQATMKTAEKAPTLVRVFPLDSPGVHQLEGDVVIGRAPPCEIVILSDLVSRRHARLEQTSQGWRIKDLDSANGLFVNGTRVCSRELRDGDIIRVGATLLRFAAWDTAGPEPVDAAQELAGSSLHELRQQLRRLAGERRPVVLFGAAGSGKAMAARALHRLGQGGPLVTVDCTTVSRERLDEQVLAASGGTLFLRLVGALAPGTQRRLAQRLDNTVRLVVSSREPLALEPELQAHLADAVELELPPLEHRAQDVPELVRRIMQTRGQVRRVTVEAMEQLCCERWPENVRQLERTVARALERTPEDAPLDIEQGDVGACALYTELTQALSRHRGDVNAAAAALGISRSQLYRRAQKLGVRVADFRG
jgi:transcriptional regulator of acetoin/glycerol metabolism